MNLILNLNMTLTQTLNLTKSKSNLMKTLMPLALPIQLFKLNLRLNTRKLALRDNSLLKVIVMLSETETFVLSGYLKVIVGAAVSGTRDYNSSTVALKIHSLRRKI